MAFHGVPRFVLARNLCSAPDDRGSLPTEIPGGPRARAREARREALDSKGSSLATSGAGGALVA